MEITSQTNILGIIDPRDQEIAEALEVIGKNSSNLYHTEGPEKEKMDDEEIIKDERVIQKIQFIRDKIMEAVKMKSIKTFTYYCEEVNEEVMGYEKIFKNGEETNVTEVWHTDRDENFYICTFGDIASVEILDGTLRLKSKSDHELLHEARKAERERTAYVVAIPDGYICHIKKDVIHRRGLSQKEGLRHTFKLYNSSRPTPIQ